MVKQSLETYSEGKLNQCAVPILQDKMENRSLDKIKTWSQSIIWGQQLSPVPLAPLMGSLSYLVNILGFVHTLASGDMAEQSNYWLEETGVWIPAPSLSASSWLSFCLLLFLYNL